jgi:signal transduction histidine kinase
VGGLVAYWDSARLKRVIENLLSDAIKYSPFESDVTVTVYSEHVDGRTCARLNVQDRGIGIPAADLARIFEPYYRAGNVVNRLPREGIGLEGARQIIEQHGGSITVQSSEGEGATFKVRLPLPPH